MLNSPNIIEKNAETIKYWLKHIDFDTEHPGYAKDIYNKLDEIIKYTNKKSTIPRPAAINVHIYYRDNVLLADIKYITDDKHIDTIHWDNINEREKYIYNGYTIFKDDRYIINDLYHMDHPNNTVTYK